MDQHTAPGQAARRILTGYLLVFTLALFAGCAWTMSPDRSKRISDCLEQCNAQDGRSAAPDSNSAQGDWGTRDSRSSCEKKCHGK